MDIVNFHFLPSTNRTPFNKSAWFVMKVIIAGSSHVRRLADYVSNLPNAQCDISELLDLRFCIVGGGKLENSSHIAVMESELSRTRPDCLILHVGCNDLDNNLADEHFCRQLVLKLVLLAKTFVKRYDVKTVFLCNLPKDFHQIFRSAPVYSLKAKI